MSTETDLERELRRTLHDDRPHLVDTGLPARVDRGLRRTQQRRRLGAVVAALAATGAVAATLLTGGSSTSRGLDVTSPPSAPPVSCAAMSVASTGVRGDELTLVLRNGGPGGCDVRGLTVTTMLGDDLRIGDRATADDLRPGDEIAERALGPGGEATVRATTDTCQSAGLPVVVVFADGSRLDLTFPGEQQLCTEPGFGLQITSLGTSTTSG